MCRLLSSVLITLVLIVGATSTAPVAHAQFAQDPLLPSSLSAPAPTQTGNNSSSYFGPTQTNTFGTTPTDTVTGSYNPTTGTYGNATTNALDATTNATLQSAGLTPTSGMGSSTNSSSAAASTDGAAIPTNLKQEDGMNGVLAWIMSLFAWLLGVAAITLDNAVFYTVVSMGNFVKDLTGVGVTWRILRDIANIFIIFGFLAIGISIILSSERMGYGKKMIPMLIASAIFINFSLFITEAVIDVGNLFATQFYTQINGGQPAGAKSFDSGSLRTKNEGISDKVMNQLGLQGMYGDARTNTDLLKNENSMIIFFMGIILFLIMAFVFFSLAFILIARFVYLLFLIIISPIGFAGYAVPWLKGTSDWWADELTSQTITAPVLMLSLYVALAIITDASFLTGVGGDGATWTGFVEGKNLPGFASLLLTFFIAMGLLVAVIIISKKLSAVGGKWATQSAGKLTFGATAWGLRSTGGWMSQRASERWRKTSLSRAPVIGRAVSGALDRGAKASFDMRATKLVSKIPGGGIDAGEAEKGGYRDWEKKKIKEHEDYAKTLEQTKKEKAQQTTEESRKKMMEQTVKDIKSQNEGEMRNLLTQHNVDLKPFSDRVNAARASLAEAEKTGNKAVIDSAQLALNTALLDSQKKSGEQAKEREALKSEHDRLVKVQEDEIKVRQDEIERLKRLPKEGYADSLEWRIGKYINRNVKAAKKIREEAKKSKSDKDMEKIKEFLEKGDHPKEEKKSGGHDEHKPEPKAAKPASSGGGDHHGH